MSGAPNIITTDEIVSKLRGGTSEVYEVELRGTKVPVRVLSCDEFNKIRHAAIAKVAIMKHGDDTDKNLEIQKGVLYHCSTIDPGVPGLFNDKVLAKLTLDEITYLYDQYISVLERVNPSIETISEAEFEAIVEALQKKNSFGERALYQAVKGDLLGFAGRCPRTGASRLTTGQFVWFLACRVAEAREQKP